MIRNIKQETSLPFQGANLTSTSSLKSSSIFTTDEKNKSIHTVVTSKLGFKEKGKKKDNQVNKIERNTGGEEKEKMDGDERKINYLDLHIDIPAPHDTIGQGIVAKLQKEMELMDIDMYDEDKGKGTKVPEKKNVNNIVKSYFYSDAAIVLDQELSKLDEEQESHESLQIRERQERKERQEMQQEVVQSSFANLLAKKRIFQEMNNFAEKKELEKIAPPSPTAISPVTPGRSYFFGVEKGYGGKRRTKIKALERYIQQLEMERRESLKLVAKLAQYGDKIITIMLQEEEKEKENEEEGGGGGEEGKEEGDEEEEEGEGAEVKNGDKQEEEPEKGKLDFTTQERNIGKKEEMQSDTAPINVNISEESNHNSSTHKYYDHQHNSLSCINEDSIISTSTSNTVLQEDEYSNHSKETETNLRSSFALSRSLEDNSLLGKSLAFDQSTDFMIANSHFTKTGNLNMNPLALMQEVDSLTSQLANLQAKYSSLLLECKGEK